MTAAAFTAVYSDWKLIRTRQCVQVVFEVPLEAADQAYQVLGGMPNSGESAWYAIAKLNSETTKEVMPADTKRPFAPTETPPRPAKSSGGAKPESNWIQSGDGDTIRAKHWHELSPAQQAGILCKDGAFATYLAFRDGHEGQQYSAELCEIWVRKYCDVKSRANILPETRAAEKWRRLVEHYRAWMRTPEVL